MNRKYLLVGIIIILSCTVTYLTYLTIKEEETPSKETLVQGKDITKEEYVYKEDLLELGYSIDDINTIEKKVSNVNVKNYLLTEKYLRTYEKLFVYFFNQYIIILYLDMWTVYWCRLFAVHWRKKNSNHDILLSTVKDF